MRKGKGEGAQGKGGQGRHEMGHIWERRAIWENRNKGQEGEP